MRSVKAIIFAIVLAGTVVSAGPSRPVEDAVVTLTNFSFTPRTVRIKAGSSVTWEVKAGIHTVKADNGSFESASMGPGKSFSHKFETAGTFRYFCTFHGSAGGHNMAGTVIVSK